MKAHHLCLNLGDEYSGICYTILFSLHMFFRGNGQLAVKNGFSIKFNTCLKKDKTLAYFLCPRYIIIMNSVANTLN